ncbi:hypothetical protein B0T16DRAFT_459741 [Cercophora newfieldiana]|uniref:Zn(2)-C6 fungal-type domain-containing protein n=1 Tax=Cercophora newfieldiana TaxID=92897 RepID=A0AA39Y1E0_9PEZI|nr:hypothetical protein B0T16DRAFT_459741 [Cercophora newfieldiana]
MSDYYHHFLSSMAGVGGQPNPNPLESPRPMAQPPSLPPGAQGMSNPYQSLGYFTGFPEPIMFNAPKAQRSRRKSAPGLDHIKHRRTRSGCYTCRSRRVKCDENHPTCERCRKGKRECNYPEPAPPKGSGSGSKDSSGPSQQTSPSSSPGDDDDEILDHDLKLDPILDEEEDEPESATTQASAPIFPLRRSSTASSFSLQRVASSHRQESETPSFEGNVSSASPSIAGGAAGGLTPTSLQLSDSLFATPGSRPDWSFLPQELQFYLRYYVENITNFHYCIVSDVDDFFHTTLTSLAIRNEPLLYAVVGFAAYHHMLKNSNGQISEFLQYYNRSVTLLLSFLKKKEKHSVTTLLTILQLATIEEYLGDWVNLMGHQRAALELLTQLFTPQMIVQTSLGRTILRWYSRFDVFTGIMGSFPCSLTRVWFSTMAEHCSAQAAADPTSSAWKIEACDARLRLISMEMALLFGKGASQEVTQEEYTTEHRRLSGALNAWKSVWDSTLNDPTHLVMDIGADHDMDSDDIVSPAPGVLFRPPLFAATILVCEWHSISLMHGSQSASDASEEIKSVLMEHANAICRTCATVGEWHESPAGSLIILHPCLAIAALFVQPDAKHHMWIRKKLALLEGMGYISPVTMRRRMSELFRDESCIRWWLPNDEGFTATVQNIRAFAEERNATAVSAQSENVRQIRNVFSKMHIGASGGRPETVDAKSSGGN